MATPRDKLKALEKKRVVLETKIKNLLDEIPQEFKDTTKKPGYVDKDGFPRSDIDIWAIAEARKKVIPLQNDHIAVMKQIETLLPQVFAPQNNNNNNNNNIINVNDDNKMDIDVDIDQKSQSQTIQNIQKPLNATNTTNAANGTNATTVLNAPNPIKPLNNTTNDQLKKNIIANMKSFITATNQDNNSNNNNKSKSKTVNYKSHMDNYREYKSLLPFYLIDEVFPKSPAENAGLKVGDLVIKFGSMTSKNQSQQLMQQIVKKSINKQIPVVVKRNPIGYIKMNLIPQKWTGKGLLGCHLTLP